MKRKKQKAKRREPKRTPRPRRRARAKARVPKRCRSTFTSLRRLESSARALRDVVEGIEREAGDLLDAARAEEKQALLRSLADEHVLDYLAGLAAGLASASAETLPESVTAWRDGPQVFLDWVRTHLRAEPWGTAGESLRLEETEVVHYDLVDRPDGELVFPVDVRVEVPGWRAGGKVIVKPRVTLVSAAVSLDAKLDRP